MQPRRLEILPSFERSFETLPLDVQKRLTEVLAHFSERTADNALRPELKNGFDNVWSIRVTKGYRAFYKKLRDSEGAIYGFFHVGHHDDYRILNKLASRVSISINAPTGRVKVTVNTTSSAAVPPATKKKGKHR
jgi:mRNA-degrading endonuclease RelE of RelBE toxin-antitoxin system